MSRRPHGSIRRSQVITTYGPGAMVDLPTRSVIIGGLESWSEGGREPVFESRLVRRLETELKLPGLKLFTPPGDAGDPAQPLTGITGWVFPEWFVGPYVEMDEASRKDGARRRPLIHREKLVDGRYGGKDVVPVRFVQACPNGHIDDINWHAFLHDPSDPCRRQLWIDERGTTGDLTNVTIRCDCGRSRSMATAEFRGTRDAEVEPGSAGQGRGKAPLGYCRGRRPWLGPRSSERCANQSGEAEPNRLLARSASNAWFSETVSVISIPDRDAELMALIEGAWGLLGELESLEDLEYARKKLAPVRNALGDWPSDRVWEGICRKRAPGGVQEAGFKQAELEMLLSSAEEGTLGRGDRDFTASRRAPSAELSIPGLDRVVLVHRLRAVTALVGFTRFEAPVPDEDDGIGLDVRRAAIAKDLSWLPAVEVRGEGIFLGFDPAALEAWMARPGTKARVRALREGQDQWKKRHPTYRGNLPGPRYLFLHSLAHMLITSVALDCGYASTSIQERIYAVPDVGYGILLYTGTTDAEGTLGGLVEVGRRIETHIAMALERGRLCSHDPVCSYHEPRNPNEERFLHGAACHACLLISETSCEQRNELLDRALVVPTVGVEDAAFFDP